ncbi:MAG: Crp/Fnr family transcriptional regulator, partial [Rhizorhabdus sp.]
MFTERFLRHRRVAVPSQAERARLEAAVSAVQSVPARTVHVREGQELSYSTFLIEGIMCRYMDDRNGLRQLVAVHFPGDFVDLHGYPLQKLDHDVATLTAVKIALVPHDALDVIIAELPDLARKLWFATLIDAAIHRAWLFRLGRLDAAGRVAHFLCEANARLEAV